MIKIRFQYLQYEYIMESQNYLIYHYKKLYELGSNIRKIAWNNLKSLKNVESIVQFLVDALMMLTSYFMCFHFINNIMHICIHA